jgi:hypothetical protein
MPKQKIVPLFIVLTGLYANTLAQTVTQTATLRRAATEQATKEKDFATELKKVAKTKNWPLAYTNKLGGLTLLTGIDAQGYPIYTSTENNILAAATMGTNKLWPGGSTGLSLSGSSDNVKGKLGVWDGGRVRPTHVELTGRITNKEAGTVAINDHSTHVAGTLMAAGVNPLAKGMSFGLKELIVYDFANNNSEIFNESANNMLVSNHSYGTVSGWTYNEGASRWEFRGQWNTTEDYKFGYYSADAQIWDSIAYNAPYHLIVKSAGNNRNVNGPAVGSTYWRYDAGGTMINAGARPADLSSNNGYDIIPTYGTAKNILTIGAVEPIASGYNLPQDVVISDFSSWGPTDDGRIKPDVVTDGVDVLSSIGTTDNAYASFSGTSMASPAAAGSLLLLQEYYAKLHSGAFMRSATLKALVIHTADEAGTSAGPDYIYGWGLINTAKAAGVITTANSNNSNLIVENTLSTVNPTYTTNVVASGNGSLTVTLCWTDVKGEPHAATVDNSSLKLINDLDIRIKKGATTYMPWILNPAVPAAAATTGDNFRDNVEKIEVTDVVPGETYTIEITHKNTLARGSQAFSLIVTGAGGTARCTSAPGSTDGARIDSVSFGGIQKQNVAGCTSYSNFTNITGTVESNSTLPLYVKVNACNGSAVAKIVKAWIDFNGDGDFLDAGELIAVSNAINGDGVMSTNVTIPAGVAPGNYAVLRVIVQETSNSTDVTPCGTYGKGETQDYRIRFSNPSNDVGIASIVSPLSSGCANGEQYVTIRFRNYGVTAKTNIALSGTVKDGTTTVVTLTGTYAPSVPGSDEVLYTFQTPFTPVAGKTYTINVKATVAGDQQTTNDEQTLTMTIGGQTAAPVAQAEVCNNTSVLLKATNAGPDLMLWYETAAATTPLAAGANTFTSVIKTDKTYYVGRNDLVNAKVEPANKAVLGGGSYGSFSGNYVKFSNQVPLTIETARLYIGAAGKIEFILADLGTVNGTSYSYFPIASTTLNVFPTSTGPDDPGAVFALNFSVTDPGDHIIIIRCLEGATIYRNNAVTGNPYPFALPGVFSITGNSAVDPATTNPDPNYFQRFYYFFYDMSIKVSGCPSSRVSVVAGTSVTPVVTLNGSTLTSSVATGNQWYLNSNPIAGATNQTYTATASGVYQTVVTTPMGCSSTSNEVTFGVTGIPDVDPSEIGLKVMPNPNNGRFMLDFTVNKKADLDIIIYNAVGQKVFNSRTPGFIGHYVQPVEAGKLSAGIYLLQVQHDNKSYLKKLIVR